MQKLVKSFCHNFEKIQELKILFWVSSIIRGGDDTNGKIRWPKSRSKR
jgi:hypothetical protein